MNEKTICKCRLLTALVACLACIPAYAQTVDEELRTLRDQILALSARLDQLENTNAALEAANTELTQSTEQNAAVLARPSEESLAAVELWEQRSESGSWADSLTWSGDFRYRYENIDVENNGDHKRSRIRARAALSANIFDDMQVGIGMASGGSDPVSSNQTLGGGGSTKDLRLDLAYFDWSGLANTHIKGGKFKNIAQPVGKNSMLWDPDWRPEGTAIIWDNDRFYASGVGTWLESDSSKGSHFAWIAEAGMRLRVGDKVKARFGMGYHQFDTKGSSSVFGDGDFFGNSFDPVTNTYLYDYAGLTAFGEVAFSLFEMPMLAFAEVVNNQEAPAFDTGYIFGLKLGNAKAQGGWRASWAYQDLEADAALGLLTDSDFGGGGTDTRGHIIKGSYAFRNNFNTKLTYFINDIVGDLGNERDFNRLMLDLNFKF